MSLIFGLGLALCCSFEVTQSHYGWATFDALIAFYWLNLAALERLLDKIMDKLIFQTILLTGDKHD